MMHDALATIMDKACEWTGHRLFQCYNRPLWLNRIWAWALRLTVIGSEG